MLKKILLLSAVIFSKNLISSNVRKSSETQSYAYLKQAALVYEMPVLKRPIRSTLSPWHVSSVNPSEFLAVPVLCTKTGFFILEEPKSKK